MSSVKALFSDIDGVFHPSNAIQGLDMATISFSGGAEYARYGLFRWTKMLEEALAESEDEIFVIVHSSWRLQPWASARVVRDALGPLGHRFYGMTSPSLLGRQASIDDLCRRAGISDYLILDDARDEFAPRTPNLVVTNPLLGVSEAATLSTVRSWARRSRDVVDSLHVAAA